MTLTPSLHSSKLVHKDDNDDDGGRGKSNQFLFDFASSCFVGKHKDA